MRYTDAVARARFAPARQSLHEMAVAGGGGPRGGAPETQRDWLLQRFPFLSERTYFPRVMSPLWLLVWKQVYPTWMEGSFYDLINALDYRFHIDLATVLCWLDALHDAEEVDITSSETPVNSVDTTRNEYA